MPFELMNYCELDKYASIAYSLVHSTTIDKNLGDITKINTENLQEFDLMTYGFPCQDISIAGKQKGIIKGETRSGLLYEALRILSTKKPKYAICENVKGLVGQKFRASFDKLLLELEGYGYKNYWKVLNAKDYGVPQNRERVFIVSIRNDIEESFEFPQSIPLTSCLADVLEDEVDEKYYLSQMVSEPFFAKIKNKQISNTVRAGGRGSVDNHSWDIACVGNVNPSGKGMNGNVFSSKGLSPTLTTNKGEGIKILQVGQIYDTETFSGNPQRGRVYSRYGCAPTLNTCGGGGHESKIIANDRLRKLTPKECFRLMGFTDIDHDILESNGISATQRYKMAGNSIVVPVLEAIFTNLFKGD